MTLVSTQSWRTPLSLSVSLFTFSLLSFKHLSIWRYVFCLCLRFCHRKMPVQSIIRCLPNSYLMITFPIPILYHVDYYCRQVSKRSDFSCENSSKKWSVEHLHLHLNLVIWRKEWSKRHLRGRRIYRVWLFWGLYFLYKVTHNHGLAQFLFIIWLNEN
jgi:hypothetical protein